MTPPGTARGIATPALLKARRPRRLSIANAIVFGIARRIPRVRHSRPAPRGQRRESETAISSSRRKPKTASIVQKHAYIRTTTCLTKFAPVSHQNRTCLTQFAPVPHQNHARLTQFSPVSKNTEFSRFAHCCGGHPHRRLVPSQRGPCIIQRSGRAFHSFPLLGINRARGRSLAGAPLVPLLSQANLLPSHGCPLDSTSRHISQHCLPTQGFPNAIIWLAVGPIRRTRHASSRPGQRGRSGTC
jgi:hypothetical protein